LSSFSTADNLWLSYWLQLSAFFGETQLRSLVYNALTFIWWRFDERGSN